MFASEATMSIRANVSGFDLRKMMALIGCGNPAVADRVEAYLRALPAYRYVWPENVDAAVELLRQVILGDLKPGSIEVEDSALVVAMDQLARFDQNHLETNAAVWRAAHLQWAFGLPANLDGAEKAEKIAWADARTLVHYAVVERPLFGSHQEHDGTSYGYLYLDEVQRLLGYSARFPRLAEDEFGFASAFFGWLEEITAAGNDYWCHAA
jgi:hypothetical protein